MDCSIYTRTRIRCVAWKLCMSNMVLKSEFTHTRYIVLKIISRSILIDTVVIKLEKTYWYICFISPNFVGEYFKKYSYKMSVNYYVSVLNPGEWTRGSTDIWQRVWNYMVIMLLQNAGNVFNIVEVFLHVMAIHVIYPDLINNYAINRPLHVA